MPMVDALHTLNSIDTAPGNHPKVVRCLPRRLLATSGSASAAAERLRHEAREPDLGAMRSCASTMAEFASFVDPLLGDKDAYPGFGGNGETASDANSAGAAHAVASIIDVDASHQDAPPSRPLDEAAKAAEQVGRSSPRNTVTPPSTDRPVSRTCGC